MIELNQIKIIWPAGREMDALAKQLARKIRYYKIPGIVRKRTGINSTEEISQPWLIVLCTPDTPEDPEILAEIDAFISRDLFSHVLTLLSAGTPETSFPESLLRETKPDGTVVEHEPLAANVAGLSGKKRRRRLKVERLRLLAPMLGVSFDDLMNRRHRQQMRIVSSVGSAVLALGIAFLVLMVRRIFVFRDQNAQLRVQYERMSELAKDAQDAADEAAGYYDEAAAEVAADVLSGGDCELAMLLCLDVLSEMEDAAGSADVLEKALKMRTAAGYAPVTAVQDTTAGRAQKADASDTAAKTVIAALPEEYGTQWRRELSCEGYLLGVRGESEVLVYDPGEGRMVAVWEAITYPVTTEDVSFAGETDAQTGRCGAERIRCGNILYEYRAEETPVPEGIEEQIALARELLAGRELTEQERITYGIAEE